MTVERDYRAFVISRYPTFAVVNNLGDIQGNNLKIAFYVQLCTAGHDGALGFFPLGSASVSAGSLDEVTSARMACLLMYRQEHHGSMLPALRAAGTVPSQNGAVRSACVTLGATIHPRLSVFPVQNTHRRLPMMDDLRLAEQHTRKLLENLPKDLQPLARAALEEILRAQHVVRDFEKKLAERAANPSP